jgi:hypothetical protein
MSIVEFLNQSVKIPLGFLKIFKRLLLIPPAMEILLTVPFKIPKVVIKGHVVLEIVDALYLTRIVVRGSLNSIPLLYNLILIPIV